MSILLSWLSPIRAILLWLDFIAFSLVDNLFNIFAIFAKSEIISMDAVETLTNNIYVVASIFAFFRLALLLVNSILSPEKFSESKTGVGSIFGRVVIMLALLILAPSIFKELQYVQDFIINKNIVTRLIMPSSARSVDSSDASTEFENAGKTMQKIVITSLIRPDERFFGTDEDTQSRRESQVDAFLNSDFPDDSSWEDKLKDSDFTEPYGFVLNTNNCDKKACRKAMLQYHQVISDSDRGFNLLRLDGYIGGSKKIVDPDDPDQKKEAVYYYEYTAVLTTLTGIFLSYVLISWTIDIAVRSIELAVLRVISPLFIVTIVDPKSTQSGGYFNNFLKRYGKTYADLFIKLAIISFAILGISLIQDADIWDSLGVIVS